MVRVVGLHKRLGDFALRDISFEVPRGRYAVLLGPTASGKTVLLETVAGINRPDRGEVWLAGREVTRVAPERRGIGFVYQFSMLFPHLSVRSNIAYGLRYHGVGRGEYGRRIGKLAALLGLEPLLERDIEGLSGGERQKVALARALAIEPPVLLLDEPLAALDPVAKEALRGEIRSMHRQTAVTIVHVTHDQETARVLGQSIGVMREGRLLQFGLKDEVFDRPNSAFVARFVGMENVFAATARPDGELARLELGCGTVLAATERTGRVGVCVRPEFIALRPHDEAPQEGRSRLQGVVDAVSDRGPLVRYRVVTRQEAFVVLQTKREYASRGAAVGQRVSLSFAPSAVHVFSWDGE
ncbi:MAG: ABC transporter ATP-binding protein [Candidatus Brocadiia bacterium]